MAVAPRDSERFRRYRQFQDWYDGQHWSASGGRAGRSSLTLNYARAIVDKGVAYLLGRGLGFAVIPAEEANPESVERARQAERLLYDVYWDNDLDAVDLQVATNAGVLGDGVYKVFYDQAERRIRIVNVDPFTFHVRWAGDDPSRLLRVDVAYALERGEARERYQIAAGGPSVSVVETWTAESFRVQAGTTEVRSSSNPYGFIPFVHVPNMQPPNQFWGRSDLDGLIEINRELNERMSDQADVIRYHADPPVIFRGVNEHSDLTECPTR